MTTLADSAQVWYLIRRNIPSIEAANPAHVDTSNASRLWSKRVKAGMLYQDLRDWIERADEVGELKRIDGADWNLEVGAVAEVAQRLEHSPAVLFDRIRGYP